jgi:ABC-type Fe3+/spermidine/putrescine transport system ATPase subunit
MSSLSIRGLKKQLGDFHLELDLEVREGELISLLGPSGCGKTSSLRLIAGFLEEDEGEICFGERNIAELPAHKRNTGMVFQDYALFPHMNVKANIAYGPRMRKFPSSRIEETVERLLSLIHLEGHEKRKIDELSGGEQQRVALARALAPQPDLLLLDEPLSALDAKLRQRLRREIKQIQRYFNITTIYVTHDQEEALSLSDRIAVMKDGKVIQLGSPEELYFSPRTPFVASFIGFSNLIESKVSRVGRETIELESSLGKVVMDRAVATPKGAGPASGRGQGGGAPEGSGENRLREGERSLLFFRPESIQLNDTGSAVNSFTARVEHVEFQGINYYVEASVGKEKLILSLPGSRKVEPGEDLDLFLNRRALKLVDPAFDEEGKSFDSEIAH